MVRPRELSLDHRVRRLAPDDWQTYRTIRLQALTADPSAFSSTLAQAKELPEAEWTSRLVRSAIFIGEVDGEALGIAGGVHRDQYAELISMWVAPPARGSGLAAKLIDAVVGWAAAEGYAEVRLWVVEGNVPATNAYAKSGFAATGIRQPVHEGRPETEVEMARATSPLPRTA